jgi:ribosome-binding ATPase YchF (GTP1/OBG family)
LSAIPSTADKNSLLLERLCDLLSGYHATRHTVLLSLQRAGVSVNTLHDSALGILSWNSTKLHVLVAHFLRVRFPVLLALNKSDIESSNKFVQRIREELPHEPIVRTSAAVEWWLQQHSACVHIQDQRSVVPLSSAPGCKPLVTLALPAHSVI